MKNSPIVLSMMLLIFGACQQRNLPQNTIVEDIIWDIKVSHDGKLIAVGGNFNALKIFSAKHFKTKKAYPFKNTITKLDWHPTENILAIASQGENADICLLNVSTNKFIYLENLPKYGGRAIAWNHNGELLAVGDNAAELTVFKKDGTVVRKISTQQKAITDLSWHPSKNIIVTVGAQIEIYDVDLEVSKSIKPRPVDVLMLCVAWHPSGDFFVTGDYGDHIKNYPPLLQYWKPNGEKIREIEKSKAEYRNLKWSNNGEQLATASEALRIWSKEGELLNEGKAEDLLWGIDWTHDNQKIITTTGKGKIIIWDTKAKMIKQKTF